MSLIADMIADYRFLPSPTPGSLRGTDKAVIYIGGRPFIVEINDLVKADFAENVFTPDQFGASRNGSTNDTDYIYQAIKSALAVNGKVLLLPGQYLIDDGFELITAPLSICGLAGPLQTQLLLHSNLSGDVFKFSECWMDSDYGPNADTIAAGQLAGVHLSGFSIIGDRSTANNQNAIMFYDRNDHAQVDNVHAYYIKGHALSMGTTNQTSDAYMRESNFRNMHIRNCGNGESIPALEITTTGTDDGTNAIRFDSLEVIWPNGKGISIDGASGAARTRKLRFDKLSLHGIEAPSSAITSDLMTIGDYSANIDITRFDGDASYVDYNTISVAGTSGAAEPYDIYIQGTISSGNGGGVKVDYGRDVYLGITDSFTDQLGLIMTANAGQVFQVAPYDPFDTYSIANHSNYINKGKVFTQTITAAGDINNNAEHVDLSNATGNWFAAVMPAPTSNQIGMTKTVSMIAGDSTNRVIVSFGSQIVDAAGNTSILFNGAGQSAVFRAIKIGASSYRWLLISNYGATLA